MRRHNFTDSFCWFASASSYSLLKIELTFILDNFHPCQKKIRDELLWFQYRPIKKLLFLFFSLNIGVIRFRGSSLQSQQKRFAFCGFSNVHFFDGLATANPFSIITTTKICYLHHWSMVLPTKPHGHIDKSSLLSHHFMCFHRKNYGVFTRFSLQLMWNDTIISAVIHRLWYVREANAILCVFLWSNCALAKMANKWFYNSQDNRYFSIIFFDVCLHFDGMASNSYSKIERNIWNYFYRSLQAGTCLFSVNFYRMHLSYLTLLY